MMFQISATKGVGRVQPEEWKDCYEAFGNEELKGVKMPFGPGAEKNNSGNTYYSLQYNEVCHWLTGCCDLV